MTCDSHLCVCLGKWLLYYASDIEIKTHSDPLSTSTTNMRPKFWNNFMIFVDTFQIINLNFKSPGGGKISVNLTYVCILFVKEQTSWPIVVELILFTTFFTGYDAAVALFCFHGDVFNCRGNRFNVS